MLEYTAVFYLSEPNNGCLITTLLEMEAHTNRVSLRMLLEQRNSQWGEGKKKLCFRKMLVLLKAAILYLQHGLQL